MTVATGRAKSMIQRGTMMPTTEKPKLFKKAANEQGFLKAAFLGFPGSGKTMTASKLAMGLVNLTKDKRPVFALDSEHGFDYVLKHYDQAKVPLEIARTRAFVDLLAAFEDAQVNASVLIIDSITHFWQDLIASYLKKQERKTLRMQDWGALKTEWSQFTTLYLNSKLHIIMCGRAADDFESVENEEGKLEYHKTGTKMQSEKNLTFEPGLTVEMERISIGPPKKGIRNFANRAHILKDRFDVIDGMYFDDPTFESFVPHIKGLNIGIHAAISGRDSQEIFSRDSDKGFYERRRKMEILCEEIQGELTSAYPGRSTEEVRAKTDALQEVFGTRSWTAVQEMDPEKLKDGLAKMKAYVVKHIKIGGTHGV